MTTVVAHSFSLNAPELLLEPSEPMTGLSFGPSRTLAVIHILRARDDNRLGGFSRKNCLSRTSIGQTCFIGIHSSH